MFNSMQRRAFIALLGSSAVALPLVAKAQQSRKPVIGFLSALAPATVIGPLAAFQQSLEDAGYVAGKTATIEYRWAEGQYQRLPELAADLVRRQANVIVAMGGDGPALAAKAASPTTPIVFLVGANPVASGLVASLSRPGGNATGINLLIVEIESKRIELLRQLVPTPMIRMRKRR